MVLVTAISRSTAEANITGGATSASVCNTHIRSENEERAGVLSEEAFVTGWGPKGFSK